MFCRNCGSPINPGEAFCSKCGTKVDANTNTVNQNTNVPVQDSKAGKNNSMAIVAFVFSLLGLLVAGLPCGILAVCLGVSARNHIKTFPEEKGNGFAMAGIIIGIFDIVAVVIQIILL